MTTPSRRRSVLLRYAIDSDVAALRRTSHVAGDATHANRDNGATIGSGERFGERPLRAVPGGIGFDGHLFFVVDHLLIHFSSETPSNQLIRSWSFQRPI